MPKEIVSGFKKISGNTIPNVLITSANYKMEFGAFGYSQMRGKKMSSVFKDAKAKIREAEKIGALALLDQKDVAEEKPDNGNIVKIEAPEMLSWTSSKGSTVEAALIRIENKEVYVFKLKSGKEVKLKMSDLSPESQKNLKEKVRDI